jgi:hypothetical protein
VQRDLQAVRAVILGLGGCLFITLDDLRDAVAERETAAPDETGEAVAAFVGTVPITVVASGVTRGGAAEDALGAIDNLCTDGDLDADGHDDVVIGAPFASSAWLTERPEAWTGSVADDSFTSVTGGSELGFVPYAMGDLSGDGYEDLIVGDRTVDEVGAIYVFDYPVQKEKTADDADFLITGEWERGYFGAVSAVGEADGDGLLDLAVGAPQAAGGYLMLFLGPKEGVATARNGEVWEGAAEGDQFGAAIVFGDIDGDGYADLLVAAAGVDDVGTDAGAVYGYPGGAEGVSNTASWSFGAPAAMAKMGADGRGLPAPADLDGSKRSEVILAADQYGGVAIHVDPSPGDYAWSDAAAHIEEPGTEVGASVVVGDLGGNGTPDLVMGAYQDSEVATWAGSVWIFSELPTGTVDRTSASAVVYSEVAGDFFGTAVGVVEGALVVAASEEDGAAEDAGAVWWVEAW